jgi:alpha-mannosidase
MCFSTSSTISWLAPAWKQAYEDARNLYGEAVSIARRALNHAVQSLAWNICTSNPRKGLKPIIVFNPHAWHYPDECGAGSRQPSGGRGGAGSGWAPAASSIGSITSNCQLGRNRISFMADLPPMGYSLFRVINGPAPSKRSCESRHQILPWRMIT